MKMNKALIIALASSSLFVGCSENNSITALQGKECYVTYRRDALGYATARDNGVDAGTVTDGRTGELAARGKLKEANDAWVVLETSEGLRAIPISSVLVVREIK